MSTETEKLATDGESDDGQQTSYNYVANAVRTESKLEAQNLPPELMTRVAHLVSQLVELAGTLDVFKRQVYYKAKDHDTVLSFDYVYGASAAVRLPKANPIPANEQQLRLLHGLIGKTTELGELWQQFGRHLFQGAPLDTVNLAEELGDGLWYDAVILDTVGIPLNKVLTANIDKLKKRYPDKFDADKAVKRDLEVERTTLEQGLQ